jgi:hypothetical protein
MQRLLGVFHLGALQRMFGPGQEKNMASILSSPDIGYWHQLKLNIVPF